MKGYAMNKSAQALGRLAKGKPKNFSRAELRRRKILLAKARQRRWNENNLNGGTNKESQTTST